MKTCAYKFEGGKCSELAFKDSDYCILHYPFPEDKESAEYDYIKKLKNNKVKGKLEKRDFNFEGARLHSVIINNIETLTNIDFNKIIREKEINYTKDMFCNGNYNYRKNTLYFNYAIIESSFSIYDSKIGGELLCGGAKIGGNLNISTTDINGFVTLQETEIGDSISITHNSNIYGNFNFDKAFLNKDFHIYRSEIRSGFFCKSTKFGDPKAQEYACRMAKRKCEESGDRVGEDDYHYREMEAKRKQKKWIWRILELPIQYIFGYGTSWVGVLITWISLVTICTLCFWMGNGVLENEINEVTFFWTNLYFSIVTITTLGYGDFQPKPGFFRIVAGFGAVFGTFMWAAFIAIFARKYMR